MEQEIKAQLDSSHLTPLRYVKRGSEEYYANFIGKTFGELTILNVEKIKVGSRNVWKGACRCSCGEIVVRRLYGVMHGYVDIHELNEEEAMNNLWDKLLAN